MSPVVGFTPDEQQTSSGIAGFTPDEPVGAAQNTGPAVAPPPSDVRGSIAWRNRPANVPATAQGDPRGNISAMPHPIALLQGIAQALGIPTSGKEALWHAAASLDPTGSVSLGRQLYGAVQQHHADLARGYTPAVAGVRAGISALPVVGSIASDIASPVAASASGQPVTAEQNTDALRGVTTVATMAAMPKVIGAASAKLKGAGASVRSRGVSALNAALKSADRSGIGDAIAKGQNPADALVKHMPELPSDPEAAAAAVSAKMDELHGQVQ